MNFLDKAEGKMPQAVSTFIFQSHEWFFERERQGESGARETCRLDMFLLAQKTIEYSRSQIRKLIVDGNVTINGEQVKPGQSLKDHDIILVTLPEPRPLDIQPEDIPLEILFEDHHLLVLNKRAGMVIHPAPGHSSGTLVHALLHHCHELSGIGGVQRPGIVHRLDRDTSGVMVVAKTNKAHAGLSEQLQSRELSRIYTTVVHGRMKQVCGTIEASIGRHPKDRKKMAVEPRKGRYARSLYRVLQQFSDYALLEVELKTGRTHQIRVHLKHLHHPVVGDPVYGNISKNNLNMSRQALHAKTITFVHPVSQGKMTFTTALPEDMQRLLEKLYRIQ